MNVLVGLIFVPACVLGGYLLHHGRLDLLFQPTEFLIIGGCLVGGMIIQNPPQVLKRLFGDVFALFRGSGPGRAQYLELLEMIYELMRLVQKESPLALEPHVEDPKNSPILSARRSFASDSMAVAFLSDTLKLFVMGGLDALGMDELMERDLEVLHHESLGTSEALSKAADSLPAIGIVAAVLGIILTMAAIAEGPEVVGMKVAGALVGTFLGVFMAYGFVGPLAGALEARARAQDRYYQCIRQVLAAAVGGVSPAMAVEMGRRTIRAAARPSFSELEQALRDLKSGEAAAGG